MTNTILTPTQVTRKALMILHQKLNFVGNITRDYDDSFAKEGARIGSTLKIRLPNQYVVRSGANLSTQDTTESSVNLVVSTQKGVDLNFTSVDLTLSLDDFSDRILEPAMAVLAANVESDALSMIASVPNCVNNSGSAFTFAKALAARKILNDNLTPLDNRTALLNTQDTVDMVTDVKGLFQDSASLSKQYKEGKLGRIGGMDFSENTMIPTQTTGTETATMVINGASQVGASITVTNGSSKTLTVGDIVTFAGCNRVHPETKVDTGQLMTFVCTAATGSGGTTIAISPSIVTSLGTQNVTASPTSGGAVTKIGTASQVLKQSILFQEGAFAFATADLQMPKGVDFSAREVYNGISMRIVRQYDITHDQFPCRLDILYGYSAIRPQLACRVYNN